MTTYDEIFDLEPTIEELEALEAWMQANGIE